MFPPVGWAKVEDRTAHHASNPQLARDGATANRVVFGPATVPRLSSSISLCSLLLLLFIGDAIMVAFGVPIARTTEAEMQRDALNAVHSALAMQRKLIELNARLQEQQLPMIGMRIGIFTGRMAAGENTDAHSFILAFLVGCSRWSPRPDFRRLRVVSV